MLPPDIAKGSHLQRTRMLPHKYIPPAHHLNVYRTGQRLERRPQVRASCRSTDYPAPGLGTATTWGTALVPDMRFAAAQQYFASLASILPPHLPPVRLHTPTTGPHNNVSACKILTRGYKPIIDSYCVSKVNTEHALQLLAFLLRCVVRPQVRRHAACAQHKTTL